MPNANRTRRAGPCMRRAGGWSRCAPILAVAALASAAACAGPARSPEPETAGPHYSRLVRPGPDGRLVYRADSRGNRIPDFSHAGYRGGGVAIPDVAVRIAVDPDPAGGDDRARLQAAIDRLAAMPLGGDGYRGAVLLRSGRYRVRGTLKVRASGVVVRGEDGVVIRHRLAPGARPADQDLILFSPDGRYGGRWRLRDIAVPGTRRAVTDAYVPLGARTIGLESADGLAVGDMVAVVRVSTAKWIHALGMDAIPPRADGRPVKQWRPGRFDIPYVRRITAIAGERITVDAPLFHALDADYGPSYVVKADLSGFLRNVGVDNLTAVSATSGSPTDADGDEDHPWSMIAMNRVIDGWARRITARGYVHAALRTGPMTRNVTVLQSRFLAPVSRLTGRRRYAFHLQGQLHLGWKLFVEYGRHDFVTGRQWSSGIVFLESRSVKTFSSSEPHHRYSTGILYDSIAFRRPMRDPDRLVLGLWNRLNMGSGHGWAAANSVLWNIEAEGGVAAEKPPLAQNYAIGVRSPFMSGNMGGQTRIYSDGFAPAGAHWEWWNRGPVRPPSLYRAQLRDRLGPAALEAMERSKR